MFQEKIISQAHRNHMWRSYCQRRLDGGYKNETMTVFRLCKEHQEFRYKEV